MGHLWHPRLTSLKMHRGTGNLDNSYWLGYNISALSGAVAQLGERYNRTVEVEGSSPFGSTAVDILKELLRKRGPIAQLGARHNGIVEVEGSNPSGSTGL